MTSRLKAPAGRLDAARRDPGNPSRLAPAFDRGDHRHPPTAGHAGMARVVDLNLFVIPAAR
jgi:hypothetical protein